MRNDHLFPTSYEKANTSLADSDWRSTREACNIADTYPDWLGLRYKRHAGHRMTPIQWIHWWHLIDYFLNIGTADSEWVIGITPTVILPASRRMIRKYFTPSRSVYSLETWIDGDNWCVRLRGGAPGKVRQVHSFWHCPMLGIPHTSILYYSISMEIKFNVAIKVPQQVTSDCQWVL